MSHKRKVVKIGHSMRITIPTEIVESLNIHAGETLEINVESGTMIIRKSPSSIKGDNTA
jgi:AbrB family looped-hinge helix DNA binding protein